MVTFFLNDHVVQNSYNNGVRDARGSSIGAYQRNVPHTQHLMQQHVLNDNNYPKKSYNYMASPNYLQFENTYQKYKKICHSKDVTNFRDSNNHCGNGSNMKPSAQTQPIYYDEEGPSGKTAQQLIGDNANGKSNNTLSSDDEGGFRRDIYSMKNHFNNDSNGNSHYSTKEVEPLLQSGNGAGLCQITKVSRGTRWR